MHRFKNILFTALTEHGTQPALRRTLDLATRNDATLTVFGAVPEPSRVARLLHRGANPLPDLIAGELHKQLTTDVKKLRSTRPVEIEVVVGVPFIATIERILAAGHDLLVITDDGPDSPTASATKHLLRKCPCPVWVMRPSRARRQRLLAAIDPQPENTPAELDHLILDLATSHAELTAAELHIAHAWTLYGEHTMRTSQHLNVSSAEIDRLLEQAEAEHRRNVDRAVAGHDITSGEDAQIHLVKGQAGEIIPDLVTKHRITLLVMGTVGRAKVRGLIMGSSAERILDQVRCSVLAVKPDGFVSPVASGRPHGNGGSSSQQPLK